MMPKDCVTINKEFADGISAAGKEITVIKATVESEAKLLAEQAKQIKDLIARVKKLEGV